MTMTIDLTPGAEHILRELLARQPERRPEEIVELGLNAIANQMPHKSGFNSLTDQEFEAWLDGLAAYSDQIPPMPGEIFSREMIYRDQE